MPSSTLTRALMFPFLASCSLGLWAQGAANPVVPGPSATASPASSPVDAEDGTPAEPVSVSSVRIVRLSEVRGAVQMDRDTGRGYEPAFTNIPVVAGSGLRTGDGVAEVEFEDNSSLRLGAESEVRFTALGRSAAGSTITAVEVVKGLVYVSLEKTEGNSFTLRDGAAAAVLEPGTHLRLDAYKPEASLAVFAGQAALAMGGTFTVVAKRETVSLNPKAMTVSAVAHGTQEQDLDAWDKQEQQYHSQKASFGGAGGFGLYGANDLNYYGSFSNVAGCGSVWRPYFANAAWDPFGAGVWAYYPGAGYSWVSPYPWGWLPYHSGSWISCGSAGWGWQPGGTWMGVNNVAAMRIAKYPFRHPMPTAPGRNAGTLVPVNMKALPVSGEGQREAFTFRQNSAGLGVPRQEFGNLRGTSTAMARHGGEAGSVTVSSYRGSSASAGGAASLASAGPAPSRGAGNGSYSHPSSSPSFGSSGGMHNPGGGMHSSAPSAPMSAPSGGGGASAGGGHH